MGLNISNMEERMFLVIIKGEINESEMSLKRAISEAIDISYNISDRRRI